ncbi:kinase-like protein [Amniculicola lignicola CBS 123094]|uniref:Kinase-like protein n=1 Tax=Amniculicola lignicola CBS 123094 TaxID=1392246 RepID=A0A6A5WES1_9PLEO|nr:kinase-like protein [Amniculicola lignicola CBS 123094]
MGSPYNISGSASKIFFQNKDSVEYKALSVIAELFAHPQRTLLSVFVQQAVDREVAAQFFFDEIAGQGRAAALEFLDDWIWLLKKVRPIVCTDLEESLRRNVWQRDGGRCCVSKAKNEQRHNGSLLLAYILPPSIFHDRDMINNSWAKNPSLLIETKFPLVMLKNEAVGLASLPNSELLGMHHRFAQALAHLEVSEYMKQASEDSARRTPVNRSSWNSWYPQALSGIARYIWTWIPAFLRVLAYKHLVGVSTGLYGNNGFKRTFRLPFNMYLRVAKDDWAPKHKAEVQTLRLVEKFTQIPAPRAIDTVQYFDSSFLLMSGLPGETIGRRIHIMTDEQLDSVAQDLKRYITELRQIPNKTGSGFKICNALGEGILDWRIPDSQRKELKFQNETQFNEYLVDDLPIDEDTRKLVSKAHGVEHNIVFTHADLNMRNILVDDNGKLSGIVDWECAGWYPEYWEFTKAHNQAQYTVRWTADVMDRVFLGYRDELKAEDMLCSMTPPW